VRCLGLVFEWTLTVADATSYLKSCVAPPLRSYDIWTDSIYRLYIAVNSYSCRNRAPGNFI